MKSRLQKTWLLEVLSHIRAVKDGRSVRRKHLSTCQKTGISPERLPFRSIGSEANQLDAAAISGSLGVVDGRLLVHIRWGHHAFHQAGAHESR